MHALLCQRFNDHQSELAQLDSVTCELRMTGDDAQNIARRRIRFHPEQEIRGGQIEEAESMRLDDLPAMQHFTKFAPGLGHADGEDRVARLRRSQLVADGTDT